MSDFDIFHRKERKWLDLLKVIITFGFIFMISEAIIY